MLLRQCIDRSTLGLAAIASVLGGDLAFAQAPPGPERPWAIPESAIRRAAAQGDLANLDLAFSNTLQVRSGPEQPVVESARRLQIAHCDGNMIDPDNLPHR